MFGWVSNVVKSVASEAQQLGHIAVESLVGEEEDEPQREGASQECSDQPTPPPAPSTNDEQPPVPQRSQDAEGESWAPSELRFVGRHTGKFAGWLVEKSAGVALSIMGEESSESTEKDGTLAAVAQHVREVGQESNDATNADHHTTEQPLPILRACRGYLGMLKKQNASQVDAELTPGSRLIRREEIDAFIRPSDVSEFDFSEDNDRACSWIAATTVGEQFDNVRKRRNLACDKSTGDKLHGEKAVQAFDSFPQECTEFCDEIGDIVLRELASLFARPQRDLTTTLHDLLTQRRQDADSSDDDGRSSAQKWYLHRRTDAHGVHLDLSRAQHVAQNVKDLVTFALCEMFRGCDGTCKVIQDAAAWARRSNHPDAKQIKETSMKLRGECLSANVSVVMLIEEALEIVKDVFPTEEGVAPFEALTIGGPLEYVRDPTVTVSTEHGDVEMVAAGNGEHHHLHPQSDPTSSN